MNARDTIQSRIAITLFIREFFKIVANVRRYVQLAQLRGGACFCTRDAMQGYEVVLSIVALAKTVTPVGVPGGSRGGPHR